MNTNEFSKYALLRGEKDNDESENVDTSDGNFMNKTYTNDQFLFKKHQVSFPLTCNNNNEKRRVQSEFDYPVTTYPVGTLIILNMTYFEDELLTRKGSIHDVSALKTQFLQMGYVVEVFSNLTTSQVNVLLKLISNKQEYKSLSCFVFAILSHGVENHFYTYDGTVSVHSVAQAFSSFHGTPKLIMFQKCRGDELMQDYAQSETDGPITPGLQDRSILEGTILCEDEKLLNDEIYKVNIHDLIEESTNNSSAKREQVEKMLPRKISLSEDLDIIDTPPFFTKNTIDCLPMTLGGRDVVYAYSTVLGYRSFRNTVHGSWFIQLFCRVVSECAYNKDVLKLLTIVNRLLAEKQSRGVENNKKQIGSFVTNLEKEFYLTA